MDRDKDELRFVRECSVKALAKMLKRFQPEDFDKIYIKVFDIYSKHYSPYAKEKNYKGNWFKDETP